MGIPLYKCVRGTSALEGFHQKIRQLIPGFNISPFYDVALLHEFINRWNHEIDVCILGIPTEYARFYDHWEIVDEIRDVADWEEVVAKPHPQLSSLHDIHGKGTGEEFGLVGWESIRVKKTAEDIESEVGEVVDAYNDGTLVDDDSEGLAENVYCSHHKIFGLQSLVGRPVGLCACSQHWWRNHENGN